MSDPIRIGHCDHIIVGGVCGACSGTELSTMQPIDNRPNLRAINYRAGNHGHFTASMLTALASSDYPALAGLGTRDDDDFSISLIDAWASACEVLSFYQERHANEAFLQTAVERLSVGEIARLIGYKLHPGSAAETDLVFLMDDPPGAEPDVADLMIAQGTAVQSQPGPDEVPQVFETLEPVNARVAWNRLRPRQGRLIVPASGDRGLWLEGIATGLTPGDALLLVGRQRDDVNASDFTVESDRWNFRRVLTVEPDPLIGRTWVGWNEPLGALHPPAMAPEDDVRIFLLAQRSSLFGYNAPHPRAMSEEQRDSFGYVDQTFTELFIEGIEVEPSRTPSRITGSDANSGDWNFTHPGTGEISLDAVYKGFVEDSWVTLTLPTGLTELYRIVTSLDDGESKYAISGQTTRLSLDRSTTLGTFAASYRRVSVYGASSERDLAETPLIDWVAGDTIELANRVQDLPVGRRLMVTGRRAQVSVAIDEVTLVPLHGGPTRTIIRGGRLTLMTAPQDLPAPPGMLLWTLGDADGFVGTVQATINSFDPIRADESSEIAAERAIVRRVDDLDATHSLLVLETALTSSYDRGDLSIHANVVPSSHGEGTTEILGGGDPSQPFQTFGLKQNPVTQQIAPTANGIESTLQLRVDGVLWDELPDLYARDPRGRVFTSTLTDDGSTVIHFGDGKSGARPNAGRDNLVAEYRKGLGRAGNVRAGQLSLPLERPLGLRDVTNPLPASGGADPEVTEDARRNAPIYTLTLGRLVSITDYRDFALGYPGIAKADANWVWDGQTRKIVVTVAGTDGEAITNEGPIYPALLAAYRELGDPFVQFELVSYTAATFHLALRVAVDPAHVASDVLEATESTIRDAFSFANRDFGKPVALSRIAAVAHTTDGVVAVDIDRLYRDVGPQTAPVAHPLLIAQVGRLDPVGILPAEILTISTGPLDSIEVLS